MDERLRPLLAPHYSSGFNWIPDARVGEILQVALSVTGPCCIDDAVFSVRCQNIDLPASITAHIQIIAPSPVPSHDPRRVVILMRYVPGPVSPDEERSMIQSQCAEFRPTIPNFLLLWLNGPAMAPQLKYVEWPAYYQQRAQASLRRAIADSGAL